MGPKSVFGNCFQNVFIPLWSQQIMSTVIVLIQVEISDKIEYQYAHILALLYLNGLPSDTDFPRHDLGL